VELYLYTYVILDDLCPLVRLKVVLFSEAIYFPILYIFRANFYHINLTIADTLLRF